MRDPTKAVEEICSKNTVVLRKVTVIKAKCNIFKNYSPQTLPRKNFCVTFVYLLLFLVLLPSLAH